MANNQRTQQQPRSNDAKQKPVHEIRMGRIKAAIWANETDNGTRHNVVITRLYKDGGMQLNTALDFFILQGSCVGGSTTVSNKLSRIHSV